jgi:hypothetical protein
LNTSLPCRQIILSWCLPGPDITLMDGVGVKTIKDDWDRVKTCFSFYSDPVLVSDSTLIYLAERFFCRIRCNSLPA